MKRRGTTILTTLTLTLALAGLFTVEAGARDGVNRNSRESSRERLSVRSTSTSDRILVESRGRIDRTRSAGTYPRDGARRYLAFLLFGQQDSAGRRSARERMVLWQMLRSGRAR